MNWKERYQVGDEVYHTRLFEAGSGHALRGAVKEIGEETILIDWDGESEEREYFMSQFDYITPAVENEMKDHMFRISSNWDCELSLKQLIADAKFVFSHDGYKGVRPHIVLNTPIKTKEGEFDIIEIDYDRYGLIANGISKFDSTWGETIKDSSQKFYGFIFAFLIKEGAKEFILDTGITKDLD